MRISKQSTLSAYAVTAYAVSVAGQPPLPFATSALADIPLFLGGTPGPLPGAPPLPAAAPALSVPVIPSLSVPVLPTSRLPALPIPIPSLPVLATPTPPIPTSGSPVLASSAPLVPTASLLKVPAVPTDPWAVLYKNLEEAIQIIWCIADLLLIILLGELESVSIGSTIIPYLLTKLG